MEIFDIPQIVHDLCTYKYIALYGTGNVALRVTEELEKWNVKISCYIVTKIELVTTNKKNEFSVPIYEVSNIPEYIRHPDGCILISVGSQLTQEIESKLVENNVTNFIPVIKYIMGSNYTKKIYRKRSRDEWIEWATKWYEAEHKEKALDVVYTHLREEPSTDDTKIIVFIISSVSPRIYKMAKAMNDTGWQVKCFFLPGVEVEEDIEYALSDIAEIYRENIVAELMFFIISSKPRFLYLFSHPSIFCLRFFSSLFFMKEIISDIIFEEYDVGQMYTNFSQEAINLEKECIENADFVCDRCFEIEYLVEEEGYKLKNERIQLFDGCSNICNYNIVLKDNRPLSLCYAGGMVSERMLPNSLEAIWLDLAKICEDNCTYLHIYPAPGCHIHERYEMFQDYFLLNKESEYFFFHDTVPYNELWKTLSQYDYGLNPSRRSLSTKSKVAHHTTPKYVNAIGNHLFDYIDSGLPIIGCYPQKAMQMFVNYGVAIDASIEEYDFEYFRYKRKSLRDRVPSVKEKFLMRNLIVDFLQRVNCKGETSL